MGLSKFISILLVLCIAVLFYEKKTVFVDIDQEERPEVSFYDSIMYEIDTTGVLQMVRSSEAYIFSTREELVNGTIITREDETQSSNIVTADYFVKIGQQLYLDGNVYLQFENRWELTTEQLEYNIQTQIAKNNLPFVVKESNNIFEGENLYLDITKNYIKSDEVKIKIEVIDE